MRTHLSISIYLSEQSLQLVLTSLTHTPQHPNPNPNPTQTKPNQPVDTLLGAIANEGITAQEAACRWLEGHKSTCKVTPQPLNKIDPS